MHEQPQEGDQGTVSLAELMQLMTGVSPEEFRELYENVPAPRRDDTAMPEQHPTDAVTS